MRRGLTFSNFSLIMNLGNIIKTIRKQRGLTQGEFAPLCGITQTYLSQIETNQKDPNLSVLKTIAEKLSVPLPIIFFLALNEEDIQPEKREIFASIGPGIKGIINDLFSV